MPYPVLCSCGRTQNVNTGDAGSTYSCECGKIVDVPMLRELRRNAGEPTISAELAIEQMLNDGVVPGPAECVVCQLPTEDVYRVHVECETISTKSNALKFNPLILFIGLFGALLSNLMSQGKGEMQHGRHVVYRLPIHICTACVKEHSRAKTIEGLRTIPVYAQLLDKFPHAKIQRPA